MISLSEAFRFYVRRDLLLFRGFFVVINFSFFISVNNNFCGGVASVFAWNLIISANSVKVLH